MLTVKMIDRLAVSAILLSAAAIPLAASAFNLSFGVPAATVPLANGSVRQFFTSGPLGTTTYRVDLDAAGRVVARTQVLTEDTFQSIRPGMRAAEVLELIGPPSAKTRFDNLRATSWEYRYHDGWGYIAEFSVMVDDSGIVASKFTAREGD